MTGARWTVVAALTVAKIVVDFAQCISENTRNGVVAGAKEDTQ